MPHMPPIITLTSDFGLGVFVGVMKGVILTICPQARLIDLDHGLPAQNIRAGALVLEQAMPHFPPGTIHLAVIDPGVGTKRKPICVQTRGGLLVGPDNGLFSLALKADPQARVYEISNNQLIPPPLSSTFHGRDVFAPAAAQLARGVEPARLGPPVEDPVRLDWPVPREEGGLLRGQVLWADHFGNLATNISRARLESYLQGEAGARIACGNMQAKGLCRSFADAPLGEPLALINSWDRLEVALNQGDLCARLGLAPGQAFGLEVTVSRIGRSR